MQNPRCCAPPPNGEGRRGLVDDGEDVVLAHDHEFFAVELDFGAGVAGEDYLVALVHVERGALAVVEPLAVPDCEDLAALGLFLGGVGQHDAGLGLGLGLDALDEDLVSERTQLCHCDCSFKSRYGLLVTCYWPVVLAPRSAASNE